MTPDSSKSRLIALSLVLALTAGAGAQQVVEQLESAETQPGKVYDNAAPGSQPVTATDGRGGSKRPNLTMSKKTPKTPEEPARYSGAGEDRAVTKPPPKEGFLDNKWTWTGVSAGVFGLLGFLALGPWGLLGGAVLGAAGGYLSHGKSWFNIF